MAQTAVEWLAEKMSHPEIFNPYIEQAKEMEKEQMIDFANDWFDDGNYIAEDYFNKIFNK